MSWGIALLLGILVTFGLLAGLQAWMGRKLTEQVGKPCPPLPESLGGPSPEGALLFFHSPNCGPCKVMHPHITALAEGDARVHDIDVTRHFELARAFGIMATPTVVTVAHGTIADTRIGMVPPEGLQQLVDALPA